jgi:bacillithiol biosynthesis deacetylase BshB1
MKLDVLALGAHPDDVELSCGGTIAKLVKQGRRVGIADLTRGELGTRGSEQIRAAEAAEAARVLGVHVRETLDIPDGNLDTGFENRLKIVRVIRKYQPDVLLFPYHIDRHPDHERAHTLCREAWFASGLAKIETSLDGAPQEPFRPRAYYNYMQWFEFQPSFIVDITDEFEQRMDCVRAFKSQFYDPDSNERQTILSTPEFLEMLRTRLAYYGDKIDRKYGEPFYSVTAINMSDLFTLNL